MARRLAHLFILLLALIPLSACERTPTEEQVRETVQSQLQGAFPEPVLEIEAFSRLGSSPLPDEPDGTARKIVYYNAQLRLLRDYSFNDWESLNPASLAQILGAAERGVEGIERDGNKAGDQLRVRGSVTFQQAEDGNWQPTVFVPPPLQQPPALDNTGPPAVARGLVDQIMGMFEGPPPGMASEARAIITQELHQAYQQITLRMDRLQRSFVIAGGPAGGEYDLIATTTADFIAAGGLRSTAVATAGSVENLGLLRDGSADVVLVQNDIAAMAAQGAGLFQQAGPFPELRALASLFPEAVHVVVPADSPIQAVGDLRGKRVSVGLPASGSRLTALSVLQAHGLAPEDLGEMAEIGPVEAAEALAAGRIDALIGVIHAPAQLFQQLSARPGIRLVPLDRDAVAAMAGENPSLVPLTLPAGTYPRQAQPVPTMAVTALLATRASMPEVEVRTLLSTMMGEINYVAAGSSAGSAISMHRARTGLSIPLHPAAELFLNGTPPEPVEPVAEE
ncbi:TAXI family TRAP transporter solute-binding subunit [Indioceanicola profundi]|uniref:TAXI family TRAP transporter solute-binding subunit n=1 Tax=Indioceanicola profundi TaxID=2220096 RepID=UPI000E6ACF04|nr:TAXI family TRAP transporter solute-binding subunit [Indioceanicola profundi]